MKINNLNNALNVYKNNKAQKTNNSAVSSKTLDKKSEDTVQISSDYEMSVNIEKLSKSIAEDVENTGQNTRLNEIKNSILNNEYNVNSEDLADSILNKCL